MFIPFINPVNPAALLSGYLQLSGGTMTGGLNMGGQTISNASTITATSFVGNLTGSASSFSGSVSQSQVIGLSSTLSSYLPLAGGTLTGNLNIGSHSLTGTGGTTLTFSENSDSPAVICEDSFVCQYLNFDASSVTYLGNGEGVQVTSDITVNGTVYTPYLQAPYGSLNVNSDLSMQNNDLQMNAGSGFGGGTLSLDSGTIAFGGFDNPTMAVSGTAILAGGDFLVEAVNGRVWGITGFNEGMTVSFQFGGDEFNCITNTFGEAATLSTYNGLNIICGPSQTPIANLGGESGEQFCQFFGQVSTGINTLDDGSGNMTVANNLTTSYFTISGTDFSLINDGYADLQIFNNGSLSPALTFTDNADANSSITTGTGIYLDDGSGNMTIGYGGAFNLGGSGAGVFLQSFDGYLDIVCNNSDTLTWQHNDPQGGGQLLINGGTGWNGYGAQLSVQGYGIAADFAGEVDIGYGGYTDPSYGDFYDLKCGGIYGGITSGGAINANGGYRVNNTQVINTSGQLATSSLTGTVSGTNGGTGVNNGTKTITLGGNLTTSGAYATTITTTGTTSITLPTSGTLLTTTGNGGSLTNTPVKQGSTYSATGQTAALASQTLVSTTPSTGFYRINYCANVKTAATTSSTLGGSTGFQVSFYDGNNNVSKQTLAVSGNAQNTTGTTMGTSIVVYAKTGTSITFAFGYTTSGSTAMAYDIDVYCELLN